MVPCHLSIYMLDLFCGSGNISFEFASRGVEKVTSVDNNKNCIDFIEKSAEQMQLNISTIKADGLKFVFNKIQNFFIDAINGVIKLLNKVNLFGDDIELLDQYIGQGFFLFLLNPLLRE